MEPQGAWRVERVRAAEDVVLVRTGEAALMQRAAYGLAKSVTVE